MRPGATNASGAANDNPYQFIGRELDPLTGGALYYMRARYLDTGGAVAFGSGITQEDTGAPYGPGNFSRTIRTTDSNGVVQTTYKYGPFGVAEGDQTGNAEVQALNAYLGESALSARW
jgi:hypothetical protein